MRVVLALALLMIARLAAAQGLDWLAPEQPAAAGSIVHFGAADAAGVDVLGALRSEEWAYARWQGSLPSAATLTRALGSRAASAGARTVLLAESAQAAAVLGLAAQMVHDRDRPGVLSGIIIRVDRGMVWPTLAAGSPWPKMYLAYNASDRAARDAAFQLARSARRAGAPVLMRPLAGRTGTLALPQLSAWLSMLELPRVQSFEDASVQASAQSPSDRDVGALKRIAARAAASQEDVGLVDVSVAASGLIGRLRIAEGRIWREGPSLMQTMEFDARAALTEIFGSDLGRIEISPIAATLLHPEIGSEVLALPAHLSVDGRPRSVLLLRRADASYGFLDLHDERRVEALVASTDARHQGRVWWLSMAGADASGKRWLRLDLERASPRRGMWWDPSHAGHGIDLQPVVGGHSLVFATYDESGKSRWYLASGSIIDGRFRSGRDGLMLMRRADELALPRPDPEHAGSVEIDFNITGDHPRCAERAADATQLALFTVRRGGEAEQWCIEPVPLPAGVPEQDVNGAWYGGGNDSGWGLSVISAGSGERALVSAILYYHDRDGWPRWALGGGPRGEAGAALSMFDYALDCRDCKSAKPKARELGELFLRTSGWCGAPELRASIELTAEDAGIRFVRPEMALQPVSQKRCY